MASVMLRSTVNRGVKVMFLRSFTYIKTSVPASSILMLLIVISTICIAPLLNAITAYTEYTNNVSTSTDIVTYKLIEFDLNLLVNKIVDAFENELCKLSIDELYAEGLTSEDIVIINKFCTLPREIKTKMLYAKIKKVRDSIIKSSRSKCEAESVINVNSVSDTAKVAESSTYTTCPSLGVCSNNIDKYSCGIIPHASNIPCPRILGITTCYVVRMPIDCCIPGRVECLWGCENPDPVLGFGHDGKPFSTVDEFRRYVEARGYTESIFSYPERGIYDFTRDIGYGYRYEAWYDARIYMGFSEGPEPNPDPNWYGFVNGFWPWYVYHWHNSC